MTSTAAANRDEPTGPDELMTSGRFAAVTLLSPKALRIYAERGLLPPRWVDPSNGYRHYAPDQVRTGWLIGLLRSADLSLDEIGRVLRAEPDAAGRLLEQIVSERERRSEAVRAVLDRARRHLREEPDMPTTSEVETSVEADRPVLSVLRRMSPQQMDEVISSEVARLRELAATAGLAEAGDPFGIFHAPITDDSDGPLEIALPVDGLTDETGADVRSYRIAGGLTARRHAEGSETDFPEILALYDEVHSWITDRQQLPAGPPREIWHNSPRDPEPLRLTIAWPYAPAQA